MRSEKTGFTLIEVMIAMVIVGILATIAIPKYHSMRRQSYVASVLSQLRHTHQAQEHFFLENDIYATNAGALNVQSSDKIPVTVVDGSQMGWSATALYRNTPVACAIFYGTAIIPPPATSSDEGEPICTW